MQKELDCLQIDLESAKARIESLHSQNLAKDSELQHAKAKLNQWDQREKARISHKDPRASVSASRDALLSYRPCGISPKN